MDELQDKIGKKIFESALGYFFMNNFIFYFIMFYFVMLEIRNLNFTKCM